MRPTRAAEPATRVSVEVRRAVPEDAPVLADVAAATFGLACPPHVTAASIATFVETVLSPGAFEGYLADPARILFLAEHAQGPSATYAVGYAMVVVGEPADPDVAAAVSIRPTAELSKIYVRPGNHGSGSSHLLMSGSMAAAARTGARGMWLGVNQLNERAQRFYAKSGFTRVGTKRFLVGAAYEDDFVYERPLELS